MPCICRTGPDCLLRLSQLLKGAVVVILWQNEADVKCQMDIDTHISLTEQAGKIRLTKLMRSGGQFPWKFLVLPHSGRGSCQLLLYRTDTFDEKCTGLRIKCDLEAYTLKKVFS